MTDVLRPANRRLDVRLILFLAALALGVGIVFVNREAIGARLADAKPLHLPDLSRFCAVSMRTPPCPALPRSRRKGV